LKNSHEKAQKAQKKRLQFCAFCAFSWLIHLLEVETKAARNPGIRLASLARDSRPMLRINAAFLLLANPHRLSPKGLVSAVAERSFWHYRCYL
jgi:hypothetical protein